MMRTLQVILKKEDIIPEKLTSNIVIVLDVLLATSTIVSLLQHKAKSILPLEKKEDVTTVSTLYEKKDTIFIGEYEGQTLDGFLSPNPLELQHQVENKHVILSTTNGTVAIVKAKAAKQLYIASLLNATAIVKEIYQSIEKAQSVVIVCSGSSNQFCLEDFYGAGYLICEFLAHKERWKLTDSAKAALSFYKTGKANTILRESQVGMLLAKYGYEEALDYVAQKGIYTVVPVFNGHEIIKKEE
ncbi:2-phosphosulfolactate phosphatase [Alkalihalobacillus sp. LMS39]|uniref:2-phosphosulfolactate phosphatase n=1 Tax=Alkalihalobacillus sp. LMS39 TaxID=2924032 RepID=UPI001FB373B7|nr:2-phosphosulfolactate phosphatase [Alkalihalobacillus sp. LMS39]UOE95656.1 2-phosphosulfolactate phosphatase [Alkalihalobacillus sp. LMS39]